MLQVYKVHRPKMLSDRAMEIVYDDIQGSAVYIIPDGVVCSILPHDPSTPNKNNNNGDNNNNNGKQEQRYL